MSTQTITLQPKTKPVPVRQTEVQTKPPPLNSGDHLSRAEFERRYHNHPEIKKAELIEGVVYMSSPVQHKWHGKPHFDIITWLGVYRSSTPGIYGSDNATIRLDFDNEPQPDALLCLKPEFGGGSKDTEDGYLEGPPELIVEIAASSASYDLYDKRQIYARNGVQEYLVVQMYEKRVDWFILHDGLYETLPPNNKGIICSEVFPGLWFKPAALWADDLAEMLAVLNEGLASPEHAVFAERMAAKS